MAQNVRIFWYRYGTVTQNHTINRKEKGVYWYNSSDQQVSTNTNQTSGKQSVTISQAKRQQIGKITQER
jgi:hypothetical protein